MPAATFTPAPLHPRRSLVQQARDAMADPAAVHAAMRSMELVRSYLMPGAMTRIPGMDTGIRLAIRIREYGYSEEEAAAREYGYRWHLALNQWINHAEACSRTRPICGAWTPPHLIGM